MGYYAILAAGLRLESFLLQVCLSVGFGLGISSVIQFSFMFFTSERIIILVADGIIFLVLVVLVKLAKNLPVVSIHSACLSITPKAKKWQNILTLILVINCIIILVSVILVALQNPHGNWDAWAIWNHRARYLFRSGLNWRMNYALQNVWSHPDYPLFLPLTVVRIWRYMGEETTFVPVFVSILFFLLTAITTYSSLTFLRGKLFGVIGTLLLLSSPYFIIQSTAQYADIPLSLYFLISWVMLAIYSRKKSNAVLGMMGFALGLSTWTKNEGLLFSAIFMMMFFVANWLNRTRIQRSTIVALFSGFTAVFIFTLLFKLLLAPANDLLIEQNTTTMLANLQDLARYKLTGSAFWASAWNIFQVPLLIFPILLLIFGLDKQEAKQPIKFMVATTLPLMLIGYFFIYINTPYEIEWHLNTSLARLFLQLWPSFVFVTIFLMRDFLWSGES
jgi:hypothetical protein